MAPKQKPKKGETWTLNTERIDPDTHQPMGTIALDVTIEDVEKEHIRKGVDRKTGKKNRVHIPERIFFRFADSAVAQEFGVVGKLGSFETNHFLQRASVKK